MPNDNLCPSCTNIPNWQELCQDRKVKVAHYENGAWQGNQAMNDTWSKSVQVDKVERFRQDVERLRYTPDALNDSLSATDSYTHGTAHNTTGAR